MALFGAGVLAGLFIGLAIEWAVDWTAILSRPGKTARRRANTQASESEFDAN